jgi:hypothetical protein
MRTVFNDNFNRDNSNTVGGGWTEGPEVSAATIAIVSNECRINQNESGERYPYIRQAFVPAVWPIQIFFKFRPVVNTQRNFIIHLRHDGTTTQNGRGINVLLNWTQAIIRDSTTNVSTASYTLTSGTNYYFWADISQNGSNYDVSVYIHTSAAKPASATVSISNRSFTNVSTNTAIQIDNASTTNGSQLYVDDFYFYDSKTIGGSPLLFGGGLTLG